MMFLYMSLIDDEDNRRYFEELYLSYRLPMFKLARSILPNDMDAEDVVHDVFYKIASKHITKVRDISTENDLQNYLLKAVKNTALSHIAKQDNNHQSFEALYEQDLTSDSELSDDSFLDAICAKEECDQVLKAINALNPTYHDIIYFRFILEFSVPQIAAMLGRSIPTVKVQLARGKKLLLEALNIKGGNE